jgi:antitoxin (DNA-binding transcriptional repressor) of toxin-antitoxin stability system
MVFDHDIYLSMDQIAISVFKARCLAILERVRKTRHPIRVTRFGKPIADVVPPNVPPRPIHWMGSMAGTAKIHGDIVAPATDENDWEVLH